MRAGIVFSTSHTHCITLPQDVKGFLAFQGRFHELRGAPQDVHVLQLLAYGVSLWGGAGAGMRAISGRSALRGWDVGRKTISARKKKRGATS